MDTQWAIINLKKQVKTLTAELVQERIVSMRKDKAILQHMAEIQELKAKLSELAEEKLLSKIIKFIKEEDI